MLARGLSVRDIEDAFKDESGRLLLSKTAVSQLGERLWEDYQAFAKRDLSEYEITYLFVDGIAERLRPGARREPVLAAWGYTVDGRRVLLHLMAGSKEDSETVTAFFEDMKMRGLNDPLLVTSDGAPGIIKAIEVCFPRAARQRCLAHRMRNLAAKVPEDVWPEFKVRVQAAYQAPNRPVQSVNDLGGAYQQSRWHLDAERLRGLEVEDHLDASGLLHRKVRRILSLEDAADIGTGDAIRIADTRAIADSCFANAGSGRRQRRAVSATYGVAATTTHRQKCRHTPR